ncbi:hypothetical protein MKEN_01322600 [Mycena kentingensis (nom. inval.)]|nr:hypothetical protein MKEN_01322600 [Mycena kentingensis (nom. inval.)]
MKAVKFVSPKKNTERGRVSDTPRKAALGTRLTRRSASQSSMSSAGSAASRASDQSSFQFAGDADSLAARSSSPSRASSPTPSLMEIDDSDSDDDDDDAGGAEMTDEQELESLQKRWTSPVYAFYSQDVKIVYRGTSKRRHHAFTCAKKGCRSSKPIYRNLTTGDAKSTKSLLSHARACWGTDTVAAAMAVKDVKKAREILRRNPDTQRRLTDIFKLHTAPGAEVFSDRPLTKAENRAWHVRWVAESLRPFRIVKDRAYRFLMKSGRPGIHIPSPDTVARDVKKMFVRTKERVKERLSHVSGIALSTDAWTAPNHRAYVAVAGSWEENGQKVECLLDFIEVPKSHDGKNLAAVLDQVADDFGVSDRIRSVTCDNATANDAMIKELERMLQRRFVGESPRDFRGQADRTRCAAHIINLVAKSLLKMFKTKKADGTTDYDDEYGSAAEDAAEALLDVELLLAELNELELADDARDADEDVFDEVAEMMAEDREEFLAETEVIRSALKKARAITTKILHSTTILLPQWKELLEELDMGVRVLPRDVKTRWNSTFDLINTLLQYKRAVQQFTASADHGLRVYEIDSEEWTALADLRDVLQSLKHATLFFSRDSATLASVVPTMDKLDALLATAVLNTTTAGSSGAPDVALRSLCTPIKVALLQAKRTLNRYYSKTYDSRVYRVAMTLHPRYKLQYFEDNDWEPADVAKAKAEVSELYTAYRDAYREAMEEDESSSDIEMSVPVPSTSTASNMFDEMDLEEDRSIRRAAVAAVLKDEFAVYLAQPRVAGVANVLRWWRDREKEFPVLSRLARDYLSISPTSVYVERQFSRGRLLISTIRNRLSGETGRQLMCLGCWSLRGYVNDDDMDEVTREDAEDA